MDSQHSNRRPVAPRFIFGLLLILVGVAYTLDQADYVEASTLLRIWPVVLMVAGAGKLLWPGSATSRWTGLLLVTVGGWLLLEEFDYLHISFWDWWPLVLVLIGLRLVWQGMFGSEDESRSSDQAHAVNAFAMLGGTSRTNNSPRFEGGDLVAFMGGCEVDLRSAQIEGGPAVIDAFAFWGGIEIRVPQEWTVTVKGLPLLGGYDDKTVTTPSDGPVQELVVKGFAIMGGVEVSN